MEVSYRRMKHKTIIGSCSDYIMGEPVKGGEVDFFSEILFYAAESQWLSHPFFYEVFT